MNIGILTISFSPETLGIARLATELSVGLAERGHDLEVVTAMPHYPEFRVRPEYRGLLFTLERYSPSLQVRRSYVFARNRPTLPAKMAWYASFTLSSALNVLRAGRPDVLLIFSPPTTLSFTAQIWRRLSRTPIVLCVQDIVPDAAIAFGLMRNPLQIRFFRWLESFAYDTSDHIVVVAPNFVDNLRRKNVPSDKMSVIYNWVDTDAVRPLPRNNQFRLKHSIGPDQFVVMYAGNIGMSQGLDVLLEAALRLRDLKDVQVLIVGGGTMHGALAARATQLGLFNVRFIGPDQNIGELQAAADVAVVTQKANVFDVNLPSKIPVIMASGRPMIAAVNPANDAAAIASESGSAILVQPGRPDLLADAIRGLYIDPTLRERMATNGRAFAMQHFSLVSALDAYEACLSEAILNARERCR